MKSRINLTIEEKLIVQIKAHADQQHTSVSGLVEEYFKRIVTPRKDSLVDFMDSLPKYSLHDDLDLKKAYLEDKGSENEH